VATRGGSRIKEWYGDDVNRIVNRHVASGMRKAVQLVVAVAKRKVNRGQPTKGAKGSGVRRGLDPSKPGTPPKVVTSELKRNIKGKVIAKPGLVRGIVGCNVPYARRQELGFKGVDSLGRSVRHLPRPFLRPSVLENKKLIKRAIADG